MQNNYVKFLRPRVRTNTIRYGIQGNLSRGILRPFDDHRAPSPSRGNKGKKGEVEN